MALLQIRNHTAQGINFHIGLIAVVKLLPGINLLSQSDFEQITGHPVFKDYLNHGALSIDGDNIDNLRTEEDTGLKVIDDELGDIIPVFKNDSSGNFEVAGDYDAKRFKASDYKGVGVATELAKKIHKLTPPKGWISGKQVIDSLEDPNLGEEDRDKIAKLFS